MIPTEPMPIEPVFSPMMDGPVYLPLIACAACALRLEAAFHLTRHRPDDPRAGLATCRRCGTVRVYGRNLQDL